jgi:hypothetical protein
MELIIYICPEFIQKTRIMDTTLALNLEDQLVVNGFETDLKKDDTSRKMIGVEVDLFSYKVPATKFEHVLAEVCGEQFDFDALDGHSNETVSFFITPKDYCLVDGGMMYTSAVSILKKITDKGLLVEEFRTVKLN